METAFVMMLTLPKSEGGLGIKGIETDYEVQVTAAAKNLTRRKKFFMDAYLKKSRTDIEYNGFYHDAEEDRAIDEERKNALASMGYGIITVSRYSFMHASSFVRVMEAIQRKEGVRPSRLPKDFQIMQEDLRLFVLRRFIEEKKRIQEELRQYSPDLASRPMLVAANKADLQPPDSDNLARLTAHVEAQGYEFYVISAATTQGTRELMKTIAGKLAALPPVTTYEPEYVKPLAEAGDANDLRIERYDDLWVVSGQWLQKLLNDINFDDYESRMYFDRQLRKSGLFDRLEEQGIEDGDTVSIYEFVKDNAK